MLSSVAPSVKKRRVFYISGYDPRGVRTCYSTCKEHAALYKGDTLRVSRRRKEGPYATGWTIASDAGAETHMTFLHWDDIIRDHWPKNPFKLTFSALRAYAVYITNGAALQALRCTPAIFLAFLYPITALIMIQLTSFAIASIGYNGVIAADYGTLPAYIVAAVLFTVTFLSLYPLAEKIKAFWLLRIYIFFTSSKGSFGDIRFLKIFLFLNVLD